MVPSPTSSSWALDNSIIDLAAGWTTSISLKIALPSFVMQIPPMGSSIIFNMALGPNVLRTIFATAFPAWILESWAERPVERWALTLSTIMGTWPCIII